MIAKRQKKCLLPFKIHCHYKSSIPLPFRVLKNQVKLCQFVCIQVLHRVWKTSNLLCFFLEKAVEK